MEIYGIYGTVAFVVIILFIYSKRNLNGCQETTRSLSQMYFNVLQSTSLALTSRHGKGGKQRYTYWSIPIIQYATSNSAQPAHITLHHPPALSLCSPFWREAKPDQSIRTIHCMIRKLVAIVAMVNPLPLPCPLATTTRYKMDSYIISRICGVDVLKSMGRTARTNPCFSYNQVRVICDLYKIVHLEIKHL